MPSVRIGPGPRRADSRAAMVDATMIAPVIGRKLSPVSIGVKPRTCCRYSETKYHIANTEQPSRKTTRLAAVSVRERKIPSGTSGRGARRSMKRKRTSSAMPAAATSSVAADVQPLTSVRTMAKVSSTRPAVTLSAPATSKWRSPAAVRRALGDEAHRGDRTQDPDRHVDEEDPLPAQQLGQHAAEQHPGRAAHGAHRAPVAERAVALVALVEGGGDDRQGGRRHHGAAEPLDRARGGQHALARRQAAGQRGGREEQQPGHEHAPAAEQVGGAAAEEQEAGEGQRVGVDHPLQVDGREAEVVADRRQRDVDDRDVEDDHELREAGQGQDPALASGVRR